MKVALDGSHDDLALAGSILACQIRLEHLGAGLHGTGGHQNLRHEDLICLEFCADDIHAGQKTPGQDSIGIHALIDRLLTELCDILPLALLQHFGNLLKNFTHL